MRAALFAQRVKRKSHAESRVNRNGYIYLEEFLSNNDKNYQIRFRISYVAFSQCQEFSWSDIVKATLRVRIVIYNTFYRQNQCFQYFGHRILLNLADNPLLWLKLLWVYDNYII